jgi:hypothetical protein
MPDVLVTFQGLRTAIEGKIAAPGADAAVGEQARSRVEEGVSHLAIALLYPARLRRTPFETLRKELARSTLKMSVFNEEGDTGWADGNLDILCELLRRNYEQLIQEDVVARAVGLLSDAVEGFAQAVLPVAGNVERSAQALGIIGEPTEGESTREEQGDGRGSRRSRG